MYSLVIFFALDRIFFSSIFILSHLLQIHKKERTTDKSFHSLWLFSLRDFLCCNFFVVRWLGLVGWLLLCVVAAAVGVTKSYRITRLLFRNVVELLCCVRCATCYSKCYRSSYNSMRAFTYIRLETQNCLLSSCNVILILFTAAFRFYSLFNAIHAVQSLQPTQTQTQKKNSLTTFASHRFSSHSL